MFVRQLEYLVALAREEHFGRAAEACHVSQPALSGALRHLEEELGVVIVQRGRRFMGFTPEGQRILAWARQTRVALDGLKQEASVSHHQLSGTLRIGAIPTTMPLVALLTGACAQEAGNISYQVLSLSTEEIVRRLDAYELDLALTYLEDQRLDGFRVLPMYYEHYVLLAPATADLGGHTLSWQEAARLPLCLLTGNMQNRRVINAAFRRAKAHPKVVVETDSIFAVYSHVRFAGLFSVVPHSLLSLFAGNHEMRALPLTPRLDRSIGLVGIKHDNMPPLQALAWRAAEALDLQTGFDTLIHPADQGCPDNPTP
jgi:DNA-binding transcriptional LysR family regulator